MTVLGGLQLVNICETMEELEAGFNTDDGIRRAAMVQDDFNRAVWSKFQYR